MNLLGVELNAKEAVVCLVGFDSGLFNVKECRTRGIDLKKGDDAENIQNFQKQFKQLITDYKVDTVVIKQRPTAGKFSGSAASFKMEAAIQLISDVKVVMISNTEMKETLKKNPMEYTMKDLELRQFQQQAFNSAYCYSLNGKHES